MSRVRILVFSALALGGLALIIAIMAGAFRSQIAPGLREPVPMSDAEIHIMESSRVAAIERVPASIEARETTIVASRLLARIERIAVRAGDYVEEGQLLASLEQRDLLARVGQVEETLRAVQARRREADQALERTADLHARRLLADADLDAARASAEALAAEEAASRQALIEARTALSYAEIRSPIDGRIVDRFAEPGDTVSPGAPLVSLYNPGSLRIEAWVRESLALELAVGASLEVDVPALDRQLTARIEEVVPAADPGSRSFRIKALLPASPGLLPGMYARLEVPRGEEPVLLIPRELVARVGQLDVAWVRTENGASRRFLRLGEPAGDGMLAVIAGLEEGDQVLPPPMR